MEINISDIFATVKSRLHKYILESINNCMEKVQSHYSEQNQNMNVDFKVYHDYITSISEISCSIGTLKLTNEASKGRKLVKLIDAFLKDFYIINNITGIIPVMDNYTYNNFMLFLTIIGLNNAVDSFSLYNKYNDFYLNEDKNDIKIKKLINNLSVQTFMLLTQNDKHVIDAMRKNITASNIMFWSKCELSKIFSTKRILDINYDNLLQELKTELTDNKGVTNTRAMNTYRKMLDDIIKLISNIIKSGYHKGDKQEEYVKFIKKVNDDLLDVEIAFTSSDYYY